MNSNRRTPEWSDFVPAVMFIIVGVAFLLIPRFASPLRSVWNTTSSAVSSAAALGQQHMSLASGQCMVTATPPLRQFDTLLLECSPQAHLKPGDPVWYDEGNNHYWVGSLQTVGNSGIIARLFTSYATQTFNIRFSGIPDAYDAYPIGGGALVVEVPASVSLHTGQLVMHGSTGQLLGSINSIAKNDQTLIERVYIRLPFSFTRLTKLRVGNE